MSLQGLSGKDFVRVNNLRYNLLMTGQLKHRMDRQFNIMCPVCLNNPHTLGHILQMCPRSHGPRVGRHNKLAEYLYTKLVKMKYVVVWEPIIRRRGVVFKPDLVYWKEEEDAAYVLDVAVISDVFDPAAAYKAKVEKYQVDGVIEFVKDRVRKTFV